MNPLVSIITVSFNSAATIAAAMESVLSQSYKNIEYIIVDGASTDATEEIIRQYQSKFSGRLSYVSEKDDGISDAFNKGIKMSQGQIIGILNSDDFYEPDTVKNAVQTFDKETGFVFGDLNYVNGAGEQLYSYHGDKNYPKIIPYRMPALNHPTVFVRKIMYDNHGLFDTAYKYAMDYELLLRFVVNGVFGKYNKNIITNMRLAGASDTAFLAAYRESRSISIKHGYPAWKAYFRFFYMCTKSLMRRFLEKILPYKQVKKIRKKVNKSVE